MYIAQEDEKEITIRPYTDIPMRIIQEDDADIVIQLKNWSGDILHKEANIQIKIGTVNLLGPNEDPYLPLDVCDTIPRGMVALERLKRYKKACIEFKDYGHALLLKRTGNTVLICNTLGPLVTNTTFNNIYQAWYTFSLQLRAHVQVTFPNNTWEYETWFSMIDGKNVPKGLLNPISRRRFFNKWEKYLYQEQ